MQDDNLNMDLPALCAYNYSALMIVIILVGACFVDVYKLYLVTRRCHAPINCGEICDRAVKVFTENLLQHCIDEALASFIAKILLDP